MLTEVLNKNSVIKLRGLLSSRYGLGLQLMSLIDSEDLNDNSQKGAKWGGALRIPLFKQDQYLATAIVKGDANKAFSESDISAISEIVKLVLEPAIYSIFIERAEQNQQAKQSATEISVLKSTHAVQQSSISASLFFLISKNPHWIPRVALHLHEASNRWALLQYVDIRKNIKDINDLKSLGTATILIKDILDLTPEEQKIILQFILTADADHEPLVIIGSSNTWMDLVDNAFVDEQFAKLLFSAKIEIDRLPTNFSLLRESLELILDRQALLN